MEINMNKKWDEKTIPEKIATIVSGIALCVWLVFQVLERTTSLWYAEFVNYIAISIICICEAFSFWKVRRSLSYIAIGGLICMLAVIVL